MRQIDCGPSAPRWRFTARPSLGEMDQINREDVNRRKRKPARGSSMVPRWLARNETCRPWRMGPATAKVLSARETQRLRKNAIARKNRPTRVPLVQTLRAVAIGEAFPIDETRRQIRRDRGLNRQFIDQLEIDYSSSLRRRVARDDSIVGFADVIVMTGGCRTRHSCSWMTPPATALTRWASARRSSFNGITSNCPGKRSRASSVRQVASRRFCGAPTSPPIRR